MGHCNYLKCNFTRLKWRRLVVRNCQNMFSGSEPLNGILRFKSYINGESLIYNPLQMSLCQQTLHAPDRGQGTNATSCKGLRLLKDDRVVINITHHHIYLNISRVNQHELGLCSSLDSDQKGLYWSLYLRIPGLFEEKPEVRAYGRLFKNRDAIRAILKR